MPESWTDPVIRQLRDRTRCPRCAANLQGPTCGTCGAELNGQLGWDILAASEAAAVSLEERAALVAKLSTWGEAAAPVRADATVTAVSAAAPEPRPAEPIGEPARAASAAPPAARTPAPAWTFVAPQGASRTSISLQSVLAVAGAGLVAVAAIVFAFFNPDLDSFEARTAIIAVSTLVFLGAAWLLARGTLQFSAEAVGALGTVFVGLDVWAGTEPATSPGGAYALAAIGTLVAAAVLIALGVLVRLRSWVWVGLAALPLVPLFAGFAVDADRWGAVVGLVGAGAVALVAHPLATRIGRRFESPMHADHITALATQVAAFAAAAILLIFVDADGPGRAIWSAVVLAALAVIAAVSARNLAPGWWSWITGALGGMAFVTLSFAIAVDGEWYLALAPVGALVAVGVVGVVPQRGGLVRPLARAGSWSIVALTALPGIVAVVPILLVTVAGFDLVSSPEFSRPILAIILGLLAAAGANALLAFVSRGDSPQKRLARLFVPFSAIYFVTALTLFATWSAFLRPTQVALALGLATLISLALVFAPRVRDVSTGVRLPFVVGAHTLLAAAAVLSWQDDSLRVWLGAAGVAVLALVAWAMPARIRPLYTAIGYAWALVILSAALDLANLELIAVLCLTTSVAALVALIATLSPWPPVAHWYAILAVTSVPFLIGVATVFSVRSGWTGLSTSVIVGLLLVILFSRRVGLTLFLRATAASLVVPAVAVAIISLGAQFLAVSASPITLPIIAAIVACVLPATTLIGGGLERLGVTEKDARWSRIALEISSLVTAGFAVVLALVRAAAGLETTLVVLVILGAGAVATALFGRRRYGWLLAGISFTGALWCVWALNGVTGLEPYLLPPTLAAAVVGVFLVARGLPGFGLSATGLYAAGLSTAVAPTLVALAAIGSEGPVPWRTWLLLGFAVGLTLLAWAIPALSKLRALSMIGSLRMPSLFVALVAATSGVVQSVRFGLSLDGARAGDVGVMGLVLVYTLASTAIAVAIGLLISRRSDAAWAAPAVLARSRWLFVPAVAFLVVGPIAAMRTGWVPIITLLAISVALLALMVVTAVLSRMREVILPPVAVTFAAAWCAAVASWSARDLRVESYSLPLGFALLAVGIIAMWPQREQRATLASWPMGFAGSWHLLAPGIVVTLLPSILATGTDPRTERAILVILLALVAIMIGNLRRLAAPFILGIIVLPIENVIVFAVQVGRNIGAQPWWITLATAGAVLLVLAVTSERRVGQGKGAAARIRDLT